MEDKGEWSASASASASSSQDSQDSEDSCDPPSKKARYSWQLEASARQKNKCAAGSLPSEDLSRNCREASCSSQSHNQSRLNVGRLVTSSNYPVFKWQTRQIAKAVVDNTINKVIEDMGFVPFAQDLMDDMFPMTQRDEHVEDEAVLMAIQSHGLQQIAHDSGIVQDLGVAQLKSWYEFENDENTSAVTANSWRTESTPKQGPSIMNNAVEPSLSPPPPPPPPPLLPNLQKNASVAEKSADSVLDKNVFEHDFLAQAVAVAIQKKGLTTYLADEPR